MLKRFVIVAASVIAFTTSAYANQCPGDMAQIDAAIETAELSAEDIASVRELRARGEELHQAGNHDESIAVLEEAMGILGIDE